MDGDGNGVYGCLDGDGNGVYFPNSESSYRVLQEVKIE